MTTQKSIERLALFLGWKCVRKQMLPRGKPHRFGYRWHDKKGEPINHPGGGYHGWGWSAERNPASSFFDPFIRLDDAMMVAEAIGGLELVQPGAGQDWFACFNMTISASAQSHRPAEAITLAALAYLDAVEKK